MLFTCGHIRQELSAIRMTQQATAFMGRIIPTPTRRKYGMAVVEL